MDFMQGFRQEYYPEWVWGLLSKRLHDLATCPVFPVFLLKN